MSTTDNLANKRNRATGFQNSFYRLEELEALEKTVDVPIPPNVVWENTENITLGGDGATYYEQYTIPGNERMKTFFIFNFNTDYVSLCKYIYDFYIFYCFQGPITLRRGDAVYVRAENGKNLIAQIDSMWTAPNE